MRRIVIAGVLSTGLLLAGCSSGPVEPTAENIETFCAEYDEYFNDSNLENQEQWLKDLLEMAPEGVYEHVEARIEAREADDDDEEAAKKGTQANDAINSWRDENCAGGSGISSSAGPAEPSGPADEATVAWCNAWAEYYYKKDSAEAESLLQPAVDLAPDGVKEWVEEYQAALGFEGDYQKYADSVIRYWHKACPGGDQYDGG